MTSSLSGKRSNRLSYRPECLAEATAADYLNERGGLKMGPLRCAPSQTTPHTSRNAAAQLSSTSVSSRPPSNAAAMLYRNADKVAIAVNKNTSITETSIVKPTTRCMPT